MRAHDAVYGAGLTGIEITPQFIRISGFGEAPDVRTLKAYGQLAVLMATRSRELRYVYARHFAVTNELYTFRAWLVTLGMNGREFKEALHASANVFQNTMAMLLARNMPTVAPQQPTPPPVEATPAPAPASRQPRNRRLFADYAREWFESYKVPKLRPGTEMNYRLIIRKHLVPFFGDMRLDEINTVDVQRFYNQHAHKAKSSVRCMGIILHGTVDKVLNESTNSIA